MPSAPRDLRQALPKCLPKCLIQLPLCCLAGLSQHLDLKAYMPRNTGVGPKRPKKKAKPEHAAEDAAAAEGVIPAVEAQSKKRVCQKRPRARGAHTSPPGTFFAVAPPRRTTAQVQGYAEQVRAAAEALEKASFVVELAEEMMQQFEDGMVDFDAVLVDGASRRARGKMAAEPAKGGVSDGADASMQASTSSAVA